MGMAQAEMAPWPSSPHPPGLGGKDGEWLESTAVRLFLPDVWSVGECCQLVKIRAALRLF